MQAAAETAVNWSYQFDLSVLTVCEAEVKLPEEAKKFEAEWGKYGLHSEQAGEGQRVAPPAEGDHQAGEQQQGWFREGEEEWCGD